jgi:hypothetical protein
VGKEIKIWESTWGGGGLKVGFVGAIVKLFGGEVSWWLLRYVFAVMVYKSSISSSELQRAVAVM